MGQRSQPQAQLERDAALARIGRARRWVILAATAATAGFAAIISAVAPGRSFAAHSTRTASAGSRSIAAPRARASAKLPPLEGAQALGLGGPPQAPQASSAPAGPAPSQSSPPDQAQAPSPAQSGPPAVSGGS